MIRAMKDAKIKPENIDYINAHGTSPHLNDLTETMAIKTALGTASKTINYKEKDEECDLDIVQNEPRKAKLNIVMSNSLGFGGHNSSIILKKWEEK